MAKAKRNIGREILEGVRQLKRGEYGRIIDVPSVRTPRTPARTRPVTNRDLARRACSKLCADR